jgi:hypothetical protein
MLSITLGYPRVMSEPSPGAGIRLEGSLISTLPPACSRAKCVPHVAARIELRQRLRNAKLRSSHQPELGVLARRPLVEEDRGLEEWRCQAL